MKKMCIFVFEMKKLTYILALCLVFLSCRKDEEEPQDVPLQLTYAEHLIEGRQNMPLALFLLEELEDSIKVMSDSVQTRYHLAKSLAFSIDALSADMEPLDSASRNTIIQELLELDTQTRNYHQRNTLQAHVKQLLIYGVLGLLAIVIGVFGYLYWRKARKTSALKLLIKKVSSKPTPLFMKAEESFEQIADNGRCPTSEEWEQMHAYLCCIYPGLTPFLEKHQSALNNTELQLCLLTCTNIRQKQVATLLSVSPQNLRNLKVRLYAKLTGQECSSVQMFSDFIKEGVKPTPTE